MRDALMNEAVCITTRLKLCTLKVRAVYQLGTTRRMSFFVVSCQVSGVASLPDNFQSQRAACSTSAGPRCSAFFGTG